MSSHSNLWPVTAILAGAAAFELAAANGWAAGNGSIRRIAGHDVAVSGSLPVMYVADPNHGGIRAQTQDLSASFEASRVAFQFADSRFYLTFPGSREGVMPSGKGTTGHANFYRGNDPAQWRQDVAIYGGVLYRDLYPGIDMAYGSAAGRRVKSEFVVAPGADPAPIRMQYGGAKSVVVSAGGALEVTLPNGVLQEDKPYVYQIVNGKHVDIDAGYVVDSAGVVSFELGAYDRASALWIDPTISYSSYVGSPRSDYLQAAQVDTGGNLYVAGWTESASFPTQSAAMGFAGNVDAWVGKLNPSGTAWVYATFLGGVSEDKAYGIDVDSNGNAYVVGYTQSSNFPSINAIQNSIAGGRDAFWVKLDPSGVILRSSFYGGGGNDAAWSIAVDSYGQSYVAGDTESWNFPLRFPYQTSLKGGKDAFLFKIGVNGNISFSTYVGGNGDDRAMAVAVSDTLTPYIAGCTTSTDFPTKNAQQPNNAGGQDAFVVRFNGDANDFVYSTYLGGSGGTFSNPECATGIAVDAFKNAYVVGTTASTNFPVLGAFQSQHGGGTLDAFVTKFNSGGTRLFSSFLGGRNPDFGTAIRVDSNRRAYVTGYTASNNFPTVQATQGAVAGLYDAFVTRVDVSGSLLNFSTYLGGNSSDLGFGLAYHPNGDLYVVGATTSTTFPVASPMQSSFGGYVDGFVTKISGASF
ncbi:MAG: SBBP repeat-containing protein [Bryobacteraceae bacterium]